MDGGWRRPWHSAITIAFRPETSRRVADAVREAQASAVSDDGKGRDSAAVVPAVPCSGRRRALEVTFDPPDAFDGWFATRLREIRAVTPAFRHRARIPDRGDRRVDWSACCLKPWRVASDRRSDACSSSSTAPPAASPSGSFRRRFPENPRPNAARSRARRSCTSAGCSCRSSDSAACPESRCARESSIEGVERVKAALAGGKGVLIFTGHFGYWELHGLAHALVLPPISVLARPLDNPRCTTLLEGIRRATGNQVIYKQGALRRVLRALEQNEGVAILADQHVQSADAVTVDFFNRPAATAPVLATLALAHRRAAHSGICAAAAWRALPHDLRASGRDAAGDVARIRCAN